MRNAWQRPATDPKQLYSIYRSGLGHVNLTSVEPIRIIELGLKFRFYA